MLSHHAYAYTISTQRPFALDIIALFSPSHSSLVHYLWYKKQYKNYCLSLVIRTHSCPLSDIVVVLDFYLVMYRTGVDLDWVRIESYRIAYYSFPREMEYVLLVFCSLR